MHKHSTLPWHDPRLYAASIPEDEAHWILLYSGQEAAQGETRSLLALKPTATIETDDLKLFSEQLSDKQSPFDHAWFGYLGYELRHQLETMEQATPSPSGIAFPPLSMSQFGIIIVFYHQQKRIDVYLANEEMAVHIPTAANNFPSSAARVESLTSNMDKNTYLSHVSTIQQALRRGDLYQANLTRKFYGNLKEQNNSFSLFCDLATISPAPYSAFLKYGDKAVVSSSPECFLHIDGHGRANMRPIKGSAPRGKDEQEDKHIYNALAASSKDRAENLMIVDLCRNDMSRGCEAGSVKVDKLFSIEKYTTVLHMVSSIYGNKSASTSSLELVTDCFPPGSMTGAPKIMAMDVCNRLEQHERGIYSGSIGWFGGDGSADLSVVIRTLLIDGKKFEFQVGGGIVLDSDPQAEWRETLIKARAIGKLLSIDESQLEAL